MPSQLVRGESSVSLGATRCEGRTPEHTDHGRHPRPSTGSARTYRVRVSGRGRSGRMAYRTLPARARDGPAHGPEPGCASTEMDGAPADPFPVDVFSSLQETLVRL